MLVRRCVLRWGWKVRFWRVFCIEGSRACVGRVRGWFRGGVLHASPKNHGGVQPSAGLVDQAG